MTSKWDGLVYRYNPKPAGPLLEEGVTEVWLYEWSGEPGPAKAMKMAALVDADGETIIVPNGRWQDVTVVDDRPPE